MMETNDTNSDDQELIRRCQAGDRPAFEMLAKRHYQKAYSLAMYWVRQREAALDISQEAFVRVHRNLKKFDPEKSFAAWLYVIVKNLCQNYLSRQKKRWLVFSDFFSGRKVSPEQAAENFLSSENEFDELESEERHALLWNALNKLSKADREMIMLKEFQEYSYREISEILDIPPGSVMSRLFYARKRLATMVKAADAAEE